MSGKNLVGLVAAGIDLLSATGRLSMPIRPSQLVIDSGLAERLLAYRARRAMPQQAPCFDGQYTADREGAEVPPLLSLAAYATGRHSRAKRGHVGPRCILHAGALGFGMPPGASQGPSLDKAAAMCDHAIFCLRSGRGACKGLGWAMEPDSIVQLVGSGNSSTVEEQWMKVVECPDVPLPRLASYHVVLAELRRVGKDAMAVELAWSAVESLSDRVSPKDILVVARPFLLAVGDSEDLRAQVADVYRAAYGEREGFEALLSESGLEGGRPVRRALRTLDVCLAINEGDYLASRDDDGAARVEAVDRSTWELTVTVGGSSEVLGAVCLADTYEPAQATDCQVMRQFAPDELSKRLHSDPVSVVIDLCKRRGNRIGSDALESSLVPDLLSQTQWSKWWTRTRGALRRCPHITLEGRSPLSIAYRDEPITPEEDFLPEFENLRDPNEQLSLVEKYLRECKLQDVQPSKEALGRCYDSFRERAQRLTDSGAATAGLLWVIACRVGQAAGIEEAAGGAVELLRRTPDLSTVFCHIESDALVDLACRCLEQARPDDWKDRLLKLLPEFPLAACDRAAQRLIQAGLTPARFDPVVQQTLASPARHFEALLWLWDRPTSSEIIADIAPVTILTRLLKTLEEARLSDDVSREMLGTMRARARGVIAARKYRRFIECLEALEPSMARALRMQVARNEGLGPRVRTDLITEIDRRIPAIQSESKPEPWQRDDVLFVTEAGLARRSAEVEHHVNVKMAENARAIGRAAERGDLSENSEYKFALEERDLLRGRLAQMNAELAMAQVISPDEVPTDHIGIGTRAVFRRLSDGERYEMSFAGPWEANASAGWLNYKAPLAQGLMGKRVGDVVEFDHTGAVGRYEIASLHNALAE